VFRVIGYGGYYLKDLVFQGQSRGFRCVEKHVEGENVILVFSIDYFETRTLNSGVEERVLRTEMISIQVDTKTADACALADAP
jgi:hypothetical protein